eukprot:8210876-Pyramimonas_sp.AAC.1
MLARSQGHDRITQPQAGGTRILPTQEARLRIASRNRRPAKRVISLASVTFCRCEGDSLGKPRGQ